MNYKTLISTLIDNLGKAETIEDVEALCQGYVKTLKDNYALASQHRYLTLARKAVDTELEPGEFGYFDRKAGSVRHEAIQFLVKDIEDQDAWKKRNTQRVIETLENQVRLQNPKEIINRAIELLDDQYYSNVAAGLLLLSGRRPIEILKVGEFEPLKDRLYFTGQAKTKGREDVPEGYEIPVLCNPELFVDAFDRLRMLKDCRNMSNENVNRNVQNKVVEKIKKKFSPLCPEINSCSDLRKVYGAVCIFKYKHLNQIRWIAKGKRNPAYAALLRNILGHGEDDVTTAQSYEKFEIVPGDNDLG